MATPGFNPTQSMDATAQLSNTQLQGSATIASNPASASAAVEGWSLASAHRLRGNQGESVHCSNHVNEWVNIDKNDDETLATNASAESDTSGELLCGLSANICREEADDDHPGASETCCGPRMFGAADDEMAQKSGRLGSEKLADDGEHFHLSISCAEASQYSAGGGGVALPTAQESECNISGMAVRDHLRGLTSVRPTAIPIRFANSGSIARDPACVGACNSGDSNNDERRRSGSRHSLGDGDAVHQLHVRADGRERRATSSQRFKPQRNEYECHGSDDNSGGRAPRRACDERRRLCPIGGVVATTGKRTAGAGDRGACGQPRAADEREHESQEAGQLRCRGHPGGEEGLGSSSMGGLSRELGGVADIGESRRPTGDVGTAQKTQEHQRVPPMGTTTEVKRRERCQRADCVRLKSELRAASLRVKELELDLAKETALRKTLVEGEVRALRVHYDKARLDGEEAIRRKAAAERKSRHFLKLAKELEEHVAELSEELASTHATIATLTSDEQARLKREAVEARARARDERNEEREHAREKAALLDRALKAEAAAERAEERANQAASEAAEARAQAMTDSLEIEAARAQASEADWEAMLARRQAERAKRKSEQLSDRLKALAPLSHARTDEEWLSLSAAARRKARERDCSYLRGLFISHPFRPEDVATVLADIGMLEDIFNSREGFELYFVRVKALVQQLETKEYGENFALFLHYEMRLPLSKIHRLVQAACMEYEHKHDIFRTRVLLHHPYRADMFINVPRIAPPRAKIYTIVQSLQSILGVQANDDGKLAFRNFDSLLMDLVINDAGKQGVPPLSEFIAGTPIHFCIQLDGTGYGMQQLNTIAIRNPRLSASSKQLRIFGLGNCADDREGSGALLGVNLARINSVIANPRLFVDGGEVVLEPLFCMDLAALRHCEHIAASGWCCCTRDFALRQTPKKAPDSVSEMHTLLRECRCPSVVDRYVLSHSPVPGEEVPRPCMAPGCTFGHNPATVLSELKDLLDEERTLASNTSKAGKAAFSRWRMAHAHTHFNIQPGLYGRPMFQHHMDQQILEILHLRDLGLPKTAWKYGVLNNASDDAREEISSLLKKWHHPLDTRRKDDNRQRAQKWFTGEAWTTFCKGTRDSPGGPIAIAKIVKIIAQDMQLRGVDHGSGVAADDAPSSTIIAQQTEGAGRGRGVLVEGRGRGGRSRNAFSDRAAAKRKAEADQADSQAAKKPAVQHKPTQIEMAADQDALQVIRETYGSRAQTIINALLAFDAYFAWYFPMKAGLPFLCPMEKREELALHCCRTAINLHEIYERISACNHGSYLPHAAIYKLPRDILKVGDLDAVGSSPLELQNAETKRVAASVSARNLTYVHKTASATTMAVSTLNHVLAAQYLKRRVGDIALRASRATERLFGSDGKGRVTLKWEKPKVAGEYCPRLDTCVKAFARLLLEDENSPNEQA